MVALRDGGSPIFGDIQCQAGSGLSNLVELSLFTAGELD